MKKKVKKVISKNEAKKSDETIDKTDITDPKIESKAELSEKKLNKTEKKEKK